MRKLVVLKFNGDFDRGFQVGLEIGLEIGQNGRRPAADIQGSLPANPAMPRAYEHWRIQYRRLFGGIQTNPNTGQVCTFAELAENCNQAADELKDRFSTWLQAAPFQPIQNKYFEHFNPTDEIRILVRTGCQTLQKLPWHQWDWIEGYDNTELAIGASDSEAKANANVAVAQNKVRILAILGSSTGINVEQDRQFLEQLPDTEIVFLEQPDRKAIDDQLWAQPWDVLFFAGHSETRETTGCLHLNRNESLTVADLRYGLKHALRQGLQLAIFNSCDGLGLAWALEDLRIPEIIVMREPVPDKVAQEFLKAFLQAFAGGLSLYQAVGTARRQLQGWESFYPCASWLPAIVQNATAVPPTWKTLSGAGHTGQKKRLLGIALFAGVVVTALTVGVRSLGWLQLLELNAYDRLMQMRPEEGRDRRLLIVEATEQDIQDYSYPIPDTILAQTIETIDRHQPRVIGLTLLRPHPVESNAEILADRFAKNDRLIAACNANEPSNPNLPGERPPPGVPENRTGFSDIVEDPDGVLRRQLILMRPEPTSPCTTWFSFSMQVALRYLAEENIQPDNTSEEYLKMGRVVFKRLQNKTGGYQSVDMGGYQILLNYRRARQGLVDKVSFKHIVEGTVDPDSFKDRIVLIGVTAPTLRDYFSTPYSDHSGSLEIPGMLIQAHAISQILSAVLDGRPLLWSWPQWGEFLWIGGWSLVGGAIAASVQVLRLQLRYVGLGAGGAIALLYGSCSLLFLQGYWVPLVPSALVILATSSTVVLATGQIKR